MAQTFSRQLLQKIQQNDSNTPQFMISTFLKIVRNVEQQLNRINQAVKQMKMVVVPQREYQYLDCKNEIEMMAIDISSLMDLYMEMIVGYFKNNNVKDVIKVIDKQTKYTHFKSQVIKNVNTPKEKSTKKLNKPKQQMDLNSFDTRATFFRFCPPIFNINPKPLESQIDGQLKYCVMQMINKIENQFEQFQSIYSICLNDPQTDRLVTILKKEYRRGKKQITREGKLIDPEEILCMKDIYLQVRSYLYSLRKKARQAQSNHIRQLQNQQRFQGYFSLPLSSMQSF